MRLYINSMFPFLACITAIISAQFLKPFFYYLKEKKWNMSLMHASGQFPSSHAAGVSAITLAVGLQDGFSSSLFAVTLAFSLIVVYDAANVRYYAGKNIQITQQLIKDIQLLSKTPLDDPIYFTRVKNVLGHKWFEIIGGIIHGITISLILYIL
ncbi:MAG: divergent PAP2 family protein [Anaerorhabdus sp.]